MVQNVIEKSCSYLQVFHMPHTVIAHYLLISTICFTTGYRSLLHDLEAQVAIVTDNLELKRAFHSVSVL